MRTSSQGCSDLRPVARPDPAHLVIRPLADCTGEIAQHHAGLIAVASVLGLDRLVDTRKLRVDVDLRHRSGACGLACPSPCGSAGLRCTHTLRSTCCSLISALLAAKAESASTARSSHRGAILPADCGASCTRSSSKCLSCLHRDSCSAVSFGSSASVPVRVCVAGASSAMARGESGLPLVGAVERLVRALGSEQCLQPSQLVGSSVCLCTAILIFVPILALPAV